MVSRRVVLGTGGALLLAAGGAYAADVDDDVLRAVGVDPKPIPDDRDVRLIEIAASEQAEVADALARLSTTQAAGDLATIAAEQLDVLGGPPAPRSSPTDGEVSAGQVLEQVTALADRRAEDVLVAIAPDVARVLASLSAGLTQIAQDLGSRV